MDPDVVMDAVAASPLWQYVVTAQRPTSVGAAIKCRLAGSSERHLVVSKGTRLEVYTFAEEGLKLLLDAPVYGRISALRSFAVKDRGELIFLLTERCNLCVLSWNAASRNFITEATGNIEERGAAFAENGQIAIIDPASQVILLHLYQGLVQIIPLATSDNLQRMRAFPPKDGATAKGKRSTTARVGDLLDPFSTSLDEQTVVAMTFIHSPASDPLLAVLHQDVRENRHLKTYYVSTAQKALKKGPLHGQEVEQGANLLIPVPAPYRGVLIVGEQTVTYLGDRTPNKPISINYSITIMTSWAAIDEEGSPLRFLLGDRYGQLHVLLLFTRGNDITELKLETLGTTSAPSSLVYLDNGHVFVGSHFGDSQLIKLRTERDEANQLLDVRDCFTNLAPIADFAVMDLEAGQGQLITCSGGFKDGTLRVVRNGVGINEIASFEMPGLKNAWSLRSSSLIEHDDLLVLSFVDGTQLLEIQGGELSEVIVPDFNLDEPTLFCGNVEGGMFVQVSARGVVLVDAATRTLVRDWRPPQGERITIAQANAKQIVCALAKRSLVYLEVKGRELIPGRPRTFDNEIACLDLEDDGDGGPSERCAVGFWTTGESVVVFGLPALNQLAAQTLDGDYFPRSLVISAFEGVRHLLVGQGDGRLYDFTMETQMDDVVLRDRRVVALGTQPITLTPFRSAGGERHVFAGCDRPTVIYSSKRKLLYSQVNLKEASNMCAFDSEDFPNALAIVSEEQLKIGTIDQIQKLHIKKTDLHEMPRRVAHQDQSKTLGLITIKTVRDTVNGDEHESSYVKLLDDQTLEVLDSVRMYPTEIALSIVSFHVGGGEDRPGTQVYIVGTAFADAAEDEPARGRIIVFEAGANRSLRLLAQVEVKGAVYCFAPLDGHFAAGINNKVYVYRLDLSDDGSCQLSQVCGHHGLVLVIYLASRGPYLVVADLMKSVSLLMWKAEEGALEMLARDGDTNWMMATEMLDDDVFIGADNAFNLFTVRRNAEATRDDERRRLELVGEYHLGGQVNKFRKGSLVMSLPENRLVATPNLIFAMSDGAIGAVLNVGKEHYETLEQLQTSMARTVSTIGNFDHASWREFTNEKRRSPAHHFIDGDLVESFLDLQPEQQEDVVRGMGRDDLDVAQVQKLVEELTRAH